MSHQKMLSLSKFRVLALKGMALVSMSKLQITKKTVFAAFVATSAEFAVKFEAEVREGMNDHIVTRIEKLASVVAP